MLPSYTKQSEDQDPLLPTTGHGRDSSETAPPTYPPAGPSSTEGRHNVEYSYFPRYPRTGDIEHAVGVLGNTKQCTETRDLRETIQIVQRGIERLSTIDPDRLTFKILSGTGESQHWAKVLDEAWERFDADPPERLAVVVSDLPGDDQLRTRREWRHALYALMGLVAFILCGVGLYKIIETLESAKKAE